MTASETTAPNEFVCGVSIVLGVYHRPLDLTNRGAGRRWGEGEKGGGGAEEKKRRGEGEPSAALCPSAPLLPISPSLPIFMLLPVW
jgi:hypothetical protein